MMAQIALDTDNREALWLVIGGPSTLSKGLGNKPSDKARKKDDGSYKNGVTKDIKLMKKRITDSKDFLLFKSLKNMEKLKKKTVLKTVTDLVKQAWNRATPAAAIIYYSGYGIKDKGDWCFVDGSLSITDLLKAIPDPPNAPPTDDDDTKKSDEDALKELMERSSYAVYIVSDCSYSGCWRKVLRQTQSVVDIFYYGAVDGKKNKLAQDGKGGGKFTNFLLTGNRMLGAPQPIALEVCNGCLFESETILWSDQIINQLKKNVYKNVVAT